MAQTACSFSFLKLNYVRTQLFTKKRSEYINVNIRLYPFFPIFFSVYIMRRSF